jgi:hypothetical protein
MDSYYYNDSTDHVFMLIMDDFCPNEFYRSWLKSWAFGSLQQLLMTRSCQKPKQTGPSSNGCCCCCATSAHAKSQNFCFWRTEAKRNFCSRGVWSDSPSPDRPTPSHHSSLRPSAFQGQWSPSGQAFRHYIVYLDSFGHVWFQLVLKLNFSPTTKI